MTWLKVALGALALGALGLQPARADFELKDEQGRTILLKDDGTWRYLEAPAASAAPASAAASAPAEEPPQAEMLLERRLDVPGGCRFEIALVNTLPYRIASLVPEFTALRTNDVPYSTQTADFGPLRPGDRSRRAVRFPGIGCADISRVQVQGGDRCSMGDLNKFSDANGQCLARVRVLPSDLLPFDKAK